MGRCRGWIWLAGLILCLFGCLCACSKTDYEEYYYVSGIVSEQSLPLEGVEVFLNGNSFDPKLVTDKNGRFELGGLSSGDVLSFSKYGFIIENIAVEESVNDATISAIRNTYMVSVKNTKSYGSVSGGGIYEFGKTATLVAKPLKHYKFDGFYIKDNLITTSSTYTFEVFEATSFTAKFSPIEYQIKVENEYDASLVSGDGNYTYGSEIVLTAKDNETYKFSYWLVNDVKYYHKIYSFVLSDENMKISAQFQKRLAQPEAVWNNQKLGWNEVPFSKGYSVSVLDKTVTVSSSEILLEKFNLSSGTYSATIVATGEGFADSVPREISFTYLRPIDAPRESGFLLDNDRIFYSFTKVNSAVDYLICFDGHELSLQELQYEVFANSIKVDLTALLWESKTYYASVKAVAKNPLQNSKYTKASEYVFSPILEKPDYKLENDILTWSHCRENVQFYLIVDKVAVSLLGKESYDLSGYAKTADIRLLVRSEGYKDNYVIIQ